MSTLGGLWMGLEPFDGVIEDLVATLPGAPAKSY